MKRVNRRTKIQNKKKQYKKPLTLDMSFDEAMHRVVRVKAQKKKS